MRGTLQVPKSLGHIQQCQVIAMARYSMTPDLEIYSRLFYGCSNIPHIADEDNLTDRDIQAVVLSYFYPRRSPFFKLIRISDSVSQ